MDEFGRFRSNVRFILCCRYCVAVYGSVCSVGDAFGILSDMEGDMTLRLQMAATRIGERAALPSFRYSWRIGAATPNSLASTAAYNSPGWNGFCRIVASVGRYRAGPF
jgi:hypothetical protein